VDKSKAMLDQIPEYSALCSLEKIESDLAEFIFRRNQQKFDLVVCIGSLPPGQQGKLNRVDCGECFE
jgi:hypothetical protein